MWRTWFRWDIIKTWSDKKRVWRDEDRISAGLTKTQHFQILKKVECSMHNGCSIILLCYSTKKYFYSVYPRSRPCSHLKWLRTTTNTSRWPQANIRQYTKLYKVSDMTCGCLILSNHNKAIFISFYYWKHKIQFPLVSSTTISKPQVRWSWWTVSKNVEAGTSYKNYDTVKETWAIIEKSEIKILKRRECEIKNSCNMWSVIKFLSGHRHNFIKLISRFSVFLW
jgi:hypothetical protein